MCSVDHPRVVPYFVFSYDTNCVNGVWSHGFISNYYFWWSEARIAVLDILLHLWFTSTVLLWHTSACRFLLPKIIWVFAVSKLIQMLLTFAWLSIVAPLDLMTDLQTDVWKYRLCIKHTCSYSKMSTYLKTWEVFWANALHVANKGAVTNRSEIVVEVGTSVCCHVLKTNSMWFYIRNWSWQMLTHTMHWSHRVA